MCTVSAGQGRTKLSACITALPISLRNISIHLMAHHHPGVLGALLRIWATTESSCLYHVNAGLYTPIITHYTAISYICFKVVAICFFFGRFMALCLLSL
ncbi:hypothetical protein COCC4DRAFT_30549 [Bipolaris maydis ATCC 48331]|uniref:Uncharacterized protein n=2 Tax=Cochliobolus heterostrophus TaxID=5016 RepID=M2UTX4_COCH5|nr:uncharacterized protein COCC4DRAFT_30549 [Bipolaris maydis ATCC 48331]EMD91303.1 hypothetical protein COCHEDRAFT_1021389 [Bipolaris maydis C5]ENI08939.1 hypothetical protein COCC4DRAFT_30549 [Bipolaris maydis ATCC 48331]KAJ6208707.1 hypothetical protein PSV09DRAFT_1021389 [Bipolaris maydis]